MKQYKNLTTKHSMLTNGETSKALLIGLDGLNFSNRITGKYSFSRKSANLPALIFLRLFGTRIVNKITNISHIKSINNHFRLFLNLYFKVGNSASPLPTRERFKGRGSARQGLINAMLNLFQQSQSYKTLKNVALNSNFSGTSNFPFSLKHLALDVGLDSHFRGNDIRRPWNKLQGINKSDKDNSVVGVYSPPVAHREEYKTAMANSPGQHIAYSSLRSMAYGHIPSTNSYVPYAMRNTLSVVSRPQKFMLANNFMRVKTEDGAQRGDYKTAIANTPGQHIAYSPLRSTGDGLWSAVGGQRTVIRHAPYAISHMPSESLYFHNQRNKIEQEVEDIRRVVVETKEAVEEKNHHSPKDMSMAIKQHLDINRISDQVYQNIERRIRIERERRGM